jgi:hypothetical protein
MAAPSSRTNAKRKNFAARQRSYDSHPSPPGPSQENDMENPNTQRRAIGLLVVFATLLTLIAVWKLPEMEG